MNIKWVQWQTNAGELKAFAIDLDRELKNGILRAVNGAVVPDAAEEAKSDTPRDAFCERIVESLISGKKRRQPKATTRLKVLKKVVRIMHEGKIVGEFDPAKLIADEPHIVKVSDKTWAVYQNKTRVAYGKRNTN